MKKIGILGGTFDPPHIGHLAMAEEARIKFALDEIWWMPNRLPPHKSLTGTTEKQRIEMVEQMVRLSPAFVLCLNEMERKGPSYTIDTFSELQTEFPEHDFYFIMGGDSYETFHLWHGFKKLQEMLAFIVMERPGTQTSEVRPQDFKSIHFLERIQLDISSTSIRNSIKEGTWNRFLVTEGVAEVIKEHQLYE
ncbi:nicotinate-nucleotide adenylyltransferase [Alkalicoccus daliensis]|uniref:Probable nicotinate-nucleotide adenylyltransferase n=1 Tax=Alkalicoccus daliensis TaxID=745820 RepID=A0A1H0BFG9_9BACI|nr:nicotinate-nucleotide adenylyltransferase [Alkalicoccus daliensis]SDN44407.1 nicotinate-nucleotide adenylyltransferase [Alkalicoccus daliensis]